MTKDSNYLWYTIMKKWYKLQIHVSNVGSENFSM